MSRKTVVYGLLDRPPLPIMLLAGAQHVLTLFGATTLVPLVLGPAMGMNTAQIAALISCVYLAMGIATLIQTSPLLGSGLPIVQGSSFSFIPPIMTVIGIYEAMGPGVIMQYVGGGLIVGGLFLSVIGYSRIVGLIRKLITPIVIGPTIMAIGFSLYDVAVKSNAAQYWPVSLLVVVCVFFFGLMSKNRYFNIFSVLSSVVIAYLVCYIGSVAGIFGPGHPAFVDMTEIANAQWFRFTGLMHWGPPKFSFVAVGALAAGFFAAMIESIGDYHSCSYAAGLDDPSPQTISRGVGAEGANCALAGFLGAVGTTSYTENVGLIGLTGVASRWVVRTGAVLLIMMSMVGKLGALVATVPTPVIGGAYIALFGTIGALGIQVLTRADMGSQRNILIVGFSFLMALGLPGWATEQKAYFFGIGVAGQVVWALMSTPMAVAGICAAFWDSIVPGTPEERGIGVPMPGSEPPEEPKQEE
ncbi:MAG: purine/pyrimidine permease [Synergistales bacterium]|nr:purine/pyrimidine permease [Synergistales bacterium]